MSIDEYLAIQLENDKIKFLPTKTPMERCQEIAKWKYFIEDYHKIKTEQYNERHKNNNPKRVLHD